MQKISKKQIESILILNSKGLYCFFAIFITGIIYTGLLFLLLLHLNQYKINQTILISIIIFFITSILSNDIINLEYSLVESKELNYKPAFHFILLYIVLFIIGLLNSPEKIHYSRKYFLSKYSLQYLLPFSFVILAVVDPIYLSFRYVFFKFLTWIGKVDYHTIVDAKIFQHNLEVKFSEVKRYGGALSLIVFTSVAYNDNKIANMKNGDQRRTNHTLLEIMRCNMRITDVLGSFQGGKIGGILSNTDMSGAVKAAERIIDILDTHDNLEKYKNKYNLQIKCGISKYSANMKTCNELVDKALDALNLALVNDRKNISIGE